MKQLIIKNRFKIFYSVIAILLVTNIVSLRFSYTKTPKEAMVNPISPLLNPMRAFIADKDVIVNFQPLRKYLTDIYEADLGVSVYFEFLNTGANISISKDAEFYPS